MLTNQSGAYPLKEGSYSCMNSHNHMIIYPFKSKSILLQHYLMPTCRGTPHWPPNAPTLFHPSLGVSDVSAESQVFLHFDLLSGPWCYNYYMSALYLIINPRYEPLWGSCYQRSLSFDARLLYRDDNSIIRHFTTLLGAWIKSSNSQVIGHLREQSEKNLTENLHWNLLLTRRHHIVRADLW